MTKQVLEELAKPQEPGKISWDLTFFDGLVDVLQLWDWFEYVPSRSVTIF